MRRFGLIGFPLGHSFSVGYFADKFAREAIVDASYENFPLETIEDLPALLREKSDLCGVNVTIPYKRQVIPYLDALSEEARQIGAVNCIRIDRGRLTGYNTDAYGFRRSLETLIGTQRPDALVLGTGGASEAVRFVLESLGIRYRMVSRSAGSDRLTYDELTREIVTEHRLIVNTTPVGMYPHTNEAPALPYDAIGEGHFLFDLIYNPAQTQFLAAGEKRGARTVNGAQMLIDQADKSWEIWNS